MSMKKLVSFCLLASTASLLGGCVVEETTYVENSRPYYHHRPVRHTTERTVYYAAPQPAQSTVTVHYDKRHHDRSRHSYPAQSGYQVQQPSYPAPSRGYEAQPHNGGYGVGGSGSGYHSGGTGGYHVPASTTTQSGGYQSQSNNQPASTQGGYQTQPTKVADEAPRKGVFGIARLAEAEKPAAQPVAAAPAMTVQEPPKAAEPAPAPVFTSQPEQKPAEVAAPQPAPEAPPAPKAEEPKAAELAPVVNEEKKEEKKDDTKPADAA